MKNDFDHYLNLKTKYDLKNALAFSSIEMLQKKNESNSAINYIINGKRIRVTFEMRRQRKIESKVGVQKNLTESEGI